MHIEVAYALKDRQTLLAFEVNEPCTVKDAIIKSKILEKYPEIDLKQSKVGVFSKITKLDSLLREKDRVEIYRPLIADPKKIRREKAR